MIPFVVLAMVAGLVAAALTLPRGDAPDGDAAVEELHERRRALLRQLHELDEDLAAGRISADDRMVGRRAIGPRLRAAVELLRDRESPRDGHGETPREARRPALRASTALLAAVLLPGTAAASAEAPAAAPTRAAAPNAHRSHPGDRDRRHCRRVASRRPVDAAS